ncbi:hypothetical protein CJ671_00625 [Aliarcobacter cryaerophilus]|uniref:Uncharacterized protein n=1 Tax=Aliarcobacter cryaerophilus TaxID=28198 RepID=A0A2S9SWA1_9BACT|nr:hypothetical protein [Aliarcobacter cryaerophilus]PRM90876.1 hypothetical protein CJ671_00625 [Aliarcobacter cryaerophilus]
MIDTTIFIISIFIFLFILNKFNVLKQISYGGRLESDFQGCYIISYPKSAELHNKGQAFDIDIDEFFRLNPRLKGKIPIEKRLGIRENDVISVEMELKERKKIDRKYSNISKQKPKKKKENV